MSKIKEFCTVDGVFYKNLYILMIVAFVVSPITSFIFIALFPGLELNTTLMIGIIKIITILAIRLPIFLYIRKNVDRVDSTFVIFISMLFLTMP